MQCSLRVVGMQLLAALLMVVVVMGHNAHEKLDGSLYPFPDTTSKEAKFRQKLESLKHLVEDDGPHSKQGVLGWHEPEFSDAPGSRFVQAHDNDHVSPPSDPFTRLTHSTDPAVIRFTEKSSKVIPAGYHRPTIMPRNTVFAETRARTRRSESEEGAEAESQDQAINLSSVLGAVGKVASAVASSLANTQAKPEDIEDCVACRYVWLQVEMDVGNSQIESNIYDSFKAHCRDAQLSRIFYPACQDMFDAVDDMIGDYMDGFTVNQMCENSRVCR